MQITNSTTPAPSFNAKINFDLGSSRLCSRDIIDTARFLRKNPVKKLMNDIYTKCPDHTVNITYKKPEFYGISPITGYAIYDDGELLATNTTTNKVKTKSVRTDREHPTKTPMKRLFEKILEDTNFWVE